ncbi:MAG: hypothetical protein JXA01_07710 [Dehalococcoidia bacterium]|nr:hypothetical protein [Dehalococcoidia bacterium]
MQQTFYCPNCKTPVAYGQPYCTRCNVVLTWPGLQTPAQNQQASQYPNQQQQWNQQQYGQQQSYQASPDSQQKGYQGQKKPQKRVEGPGLWEQIQEYKGAIAKIVIALVVIAVLIGAFNAFQGEIAKLFSKPVVVSFDTSSTEINSGQKTSLRWNVTGTSSVSITPGVGSASSSGYKDVFPITTTTYTLVASNMFGTMQQSTTVTVLGELPSIDDFSCDNNSIMTGQSATLSWNVAGATSISISPNVGTVSASGTQSVSPGETTTYTLTALNDNGNSTALITVTVTKSDQPIITTFSASPSSIKSGESSTLTWEVIGSTSININQGINGRGAKGSEVVSPIETTTYTLNAGAVTRTVTITVDTSEVQSTAGSTVSASAPVISNFSLSPVSIVLGENTTLYWDVTGVRQVTIGPDVGTFSSSGYKLLVPTATTTYTLAVSNSYGSDNATATVTVNTTTDETPPVIQSFTASPTTISAGDTANLTWNITGATTITIDQGIGIPSSYYAQPVYPTETTTYTLTAFNGAGTDTATVTVTVE